MEGVGPCTALGIDPGLTATGWAFLQQVPLGRARFIDGDVVTPRPRWPLHTRLEQIRSAVAGVVAAYEPEVVAIETFEGRGRRRAGEFFKAAVPHGMGRGAAILGVGGPVKEVRAADWHDALLVPARRTEEGRKDAAARVVRLYIDEVPVDVQHHLTDAVGIAFWAFKPECLARVVRELRRAG